METMKKKKESAYRPHKNGFPFKLLRYLETNGKSSGMAAQTAIGLNKFAEEKGSIYFDRASINFDNIVVQLHKRGLVRLLPNDHYELSKLGKEFLKSYNVR